MTSPSSLHPGPLVSLCKLCSRVNKMSLCRLGWGPLSLVSSFLDHGAFLSRPRGRAMLYWTWAGHLQLCCHLPLPSLLIIQLEKKKWWLCLLKINYVYYHEITLQELIKQFWRNRNCAFLEASIKLTLWHSCQQTSTIVIITPLFIVLYLLMLKSSTVD